MVCQPEAVPGLNDRPAGADRVRQVARRNVVFGSTLTALLGAWLLVSPWVLGYGSEAGAVRRQEVLGVAVVVLSAIRMRDPERRPVLNWAAAGLGLWITLIPLGTSYADPVTRSAVLGNDVFVGFFVFALAVWSAAQATSPAAVQPTSRRLQR